jgi:hypothetical protein
MTTLLRAATPGPRKTKDYSVMIQISRKQVEAAIALLKEKVAIQERLVHTLKVRGEWERNFIRLVTEALPRSVGNDCINRYISAHEDHYRAQADLAVVVLAELKSQLSIHETMLAEGENPSIIPATRMPV